MLQKVIYYDDVNSKYGMIAYPLGESNNLPLVIFLNAGLVDRQGPNRIYVTLCQALTKAGFTCFRFNLPGIGDNVNNGRYATKEQMYSEELGTVVNYFQTAKGVRSFILFGICTGADLAYEYALRDESIAGVGMVNGLSMDSEPFNYNLDKRYYQKYLTDARRWAKFVSPQKLVKIPEYVLMVLIYMWHKTQKPAAEKNGVEEQKNLPTKGNVTEDWIRLLNSNVEILQIVTEGSESFDGLHHVRKEIKALSASKKNYCEHVILNADHTFTSVTSQQDLVNKVITWCQSRFSKNKNAPTVEKYAIL